jgi:uncharacterized protein YktA (UPF0223 family)
MKKVSNNFTFEDAFDSLIKHREKQVEKNNELADRIAMAKTWMSLGMDPDQVSIILGRGAASLANVFGTMKFSSFNNNNSFVFKSSVKEIEKYANKLTLNVNDLFIKHKKSIKLDTSNKFLSDIDLKIVRNQLNDDNNDEELKEKLEDLTTQTAALAVVAYVEELESAYDEKKSNNLEMKGYKSLVEIAKFKNGEKMIQSALDSKAVREKFKNSKIGAFASVYADVRPSLTPDFYKQHVSAENKNKKEKKDKLNKLNVSL